MKKLFINTNRNGYNTEQCGNTMTVGELIELLQNYDEYTKIYFKNDNGYTYGSIREWDLEEGENE